jgi:hypothetical protein
METLNHYAHLLKGHLIRLSLFAALAGCITPYNLDVENASGIVVIGGQVSNLSDQSVVELGLTADTDRLPFAVSGATVWIVDETTDDLVPCYESEAHPGYYRPTDFAGTPGHDYHVQVEFPNRGTFTSDTERMPVVPGTITSRYEFREQTYTDLEGVVSNQPFLFTYIDAQLPEGANPPFLKWHVEEVFLLSPTDFPDPFGSIPPPCFVAQNADPQRITLFDGSKIHTRNFENLQVSERVVDWSFLEKHAFTIYQSSLTGAAHDYWAKVDILANQTGSIFDTPPAKLSGNMHGTDGSEQVFGYFQAASQTYSRFFIYKSDLPFYLNVIDCQYYGTRTEYPTRCLNCTTARNSSYNRPDWF